MQIKEAIQFAMSVSNGAVLGAIEQMQDAPATYPTANGGCHPLWVLGHLALVEGMIPEILFGKPNPVSDWKTMFGEGTQPVDNVAAYPSFREVRAKYLELRANNLEVLESLTESDLDKPTQAPPAGREHEFATYGRSFLVLAMHQAMHRSHVTDARRMAAVRTLQPA